MPDTMSLPSDASVLRPLIHLRQVAQQYPGLWQQLDRLRAQRGRGLPQWPDWCFLPLAGTVAALTQGAPYPDLRPLGLQIGRVGALAAWRATQGLSRFDPTVFAAVWDTPVAGDLPTALLYRLPEGRQPGNPGRCRARDPGLAAERPDRHPGRRPAGGPGADPPSDTAAAHQDQTRPPALSAGVVDHLERGVSPGCSPPARPAGRTGAEPGDHRGARGRRQPTAAPTRPYSPCPLAHVLGGSRQPDRPEQSAGPRAAGYHRSRWDCLTS